MRWRLLLLVLMALSVAALSACSEPDPYEKTLPHTPKPTGPRVVEKPPVADTWVPPPEGPVVPSRERQPRVADRLNAECWQDFQAGAFEDAVRACQSALSADPYHIYATWNLASAYAALDAKTWALYCLRRLKDLEPFNHALVDDKLRQSHRDAEWQKYQADPQYQAIAGQ